MSNQAEQPDAADRDHPVSETPATEPIQTSEPRMPPSAIFEELGSWFERWAVYARACAAQAEAGANKKLTLQEEPSAPGEPLLTKRPPAHWQAAVTQGPPTHWLALFDDPSEKVPTTRQSEEQSEISADVHPGEITGSPSEVIYRFQAELANFLGLPYPNSVPLEDRPSIVAGESRTEIKNIGGTEAKTSPDFSPIHNGPEFVSQVDEPGLTESRQPSVASPPSEAFFSLPAIEPTPTRITQFHMRMPSAVHPPATIPSISSPGAAGVSQTGVPNDLQPPQPMPVAQPKITQMNLSGSSQSVLVDPGKQTFGAVTPHQENLRAEPLAQPNLTQGQDSHIPESSIESELELPLQLLSEAIFDRVYTPITQPGEIVSHPMTTESMAPEPAWLERPKYSGAPPVSWPPAANEPHWPALPDPLPSYESESRPCQNLARRRRIDREQGGGSWNE